MHVMLVDILLQVFVDTLRATREEYPRTTIMTKHRGKPTKEVKASKPNSPKLKNQHQRVLLALKDQGFDKFGCTTQS